MKIYLTFKDRNNTILLFLIELINRKIPVRLRFNFQLKYFYKLYIICNVKFINSKCCSAAQATPPPPPPRLTTLEI